MLLQLLSAESIAIDLALGVLSKGGEMGGNPTHPGACAQDPAGLVDCPSH